MENQKSTGTAKYVAKKMKMTKKSETFNYCVQWLDLKCIHNTITINNNKQLYNLKKRIYMKKMSEYDLSFSILVLLVWYSLE